MLIRFNLFFLCMRIQQLYINLKMNQQIDNILTNNKSVYIT